jgi:hypothetical protein
MHATELLVRQFATVNAIFHDVANDMTDDEWTTRALPETNVLGFDLWHVARTQDWALQTMIRGVPEIITEGRWASNGTLTTPGIGVGMTREQADQLAHGVHKASVLAYCDAIHQTILAWLNSIEDGVLDTAPDIMAHYDLHPEYLTPEMREEVPWMLSNPPTWRCLSPALGHARDHLAEVDLAKRQLRRQST